MTQRLFWRLLFVSIAVSFSLSTLSLLFLNRFIVSSTSPHRNEFLLSIGANVQNRIENSTYADLKNNPEYFRRSLRPNGPPKWFGSPDGKNKNQFDQPPPPPNEDFQPPPPPEPNQFFSKPPPGGPPPMGPGGPGPGRGGPESETWLFAENGELLVPALGETEVLNLKKLKKPAALGELVADEDFFRIFPSTSVIKLQTKEGFVFLAIRDGRKAFLSYILGLQMLMSFATLIVAISLALLLTFFYLRKKSTEARGVLLKLEQGDLKARFPIRPFDEFGSLLLDFNRMADEIEKLVNRIYMVESTRKNLLQELGHDVRTPLTTLRTSLETLKEFSEKMQKEQRHSLYESIEGEVKYLNELFDKLMTIASLDEPHYKKSTQTLDIKALLEDEIRGRMALSNSSVQWELQTSDSSEFLTTGDAHLITRLFKNAFDNASRFAKSKVVVALKNEKNEIEILIQDDGPGFNEEKLKSFGQRREFSARTVQQGTQHLSLGLGSVIMRAIVELHGGHITAQNQASPLHGAVLILRLPKLK